MIGRRLPTKTGRSGPLAPRTTHRVYELCERLGDPLLLFTALFTIPLLIAETTPGLSDRDHTILTIANWVIYAPFALIVPLRLWFAQDRRRELSLLKFDLLVVVLQPALAVAQAGGGVIGVPLIRLLAYALRLGSRGATLKRTWRVARSHPVGMLFGAVPLLLALCSALALRAEAATEYGTIRTLGDALWWGAVTMATVGYGDISPKTPLGRLAGGATMIAGIGSFSLLTAKLAEYLVSQRDAEGRSDADAFDHYLVLGWSPTVRTLVGELATARPGCTVVVLAPIDRRVVERDLRTHVAAVGHGRVRLVCRTGLPTDEQDRARVHPERARAVIVLDDTSGDASVVTAVLGMLGEGRLPDSVAVVAELDDPANAAAISAVFGGRVSAVDAVSLGARVAAQACRQPGLGRAHLELFDFAGTGAYVVDIPEATDVVFGVVSRAVDGARVLGVCGEERGVELCPPPGRRVAHGERLVVLAHDPGTVRWAGERAVVPAVVADIQPEPAPRPDHTVICGWNVLGPRLLRELDGMVAAGSRITVVGPGATLDGVGSRLRTATLAVRDTEVADHAELIDDLIAEGVDHVVVLSPRTGADPAEADARALLTTFLVHQAIGSRDIPVVTDLADVANLELLPQHPALDAVVAGHLTGLLCAQFAVSPSLDPVLAALLAPEGPRLEALPIGRYATPGIPVAFAALADAAAARGEVALGWRRVRPRSRSDEQSGVVLNPGWDATVVTTAEDRLIVLAPAPPARAEVATRATLPPAPIAVR